MYSDIFLKGPFFNGYSYIFKITEKKQIIQIITPSVLINNYNSKYSSILINSDIIGNNNTTFLKLIYDLEKKIKNNKKKIFSRLPTHYNPKFTSVVSNWKNSNNIRCTLYNKNKEIYDINKKKIS